MLELLIILGMMAIDQTTKIFAVTNLVAKGGSIPLIPGVFHLTYVENRGAAFGMLQNTYIVLIPVTILALAAMAYFLITERKKISVWLRIAVALIFAGAAGNFIDRVVLHYVRDFFDFTLINFAIFNVADACISVGAVLLGISVLFIDGKKLFGEKNTKEKQADKSKGESEGEGELD